MSQDAQREEQTQQDVEVVEAVEAVEPVEDVGYVEYVEQFDGHVEELVETFGQFQIDYSSYQTSSLYVGDLHPSVTEKDLYEIFSQIGDVSNVHVCRDKETMRSLCYAYVNFYSPSQAAYALSVMNYSSIKGKTCRIMWSSRNPSLRKSGIGNVIIRNLERSIDNRSLHESMSAFGTVLSCKIATDKDGNSKGFGFIHFEEEASADAVVSQLNGMLINGKKVKVDHFLHRSERSERLGRTFDRANGMVERFTNVYVKNFADELDDNKMADLFGKFGTVVSCKVMCDEQNKSKGFGFVNFADHESAKKAVEEMGGFVLENGLSLYVARAQRRSEREAEFRGRHNRKAKITGINLYLKNLDYAIDNQQLRTLFEGYGPIASVKVMRHNDGVSKGFGFVCFQSNEAASKALADMNGKLVNERPLYMAIAQSKADRKAALEARKTTDQCSNNNGVGRVSQKIQIQPAQVGTAVTTQPTRRARPSSGYVTSAGVGAYLRPHWSHPNQVGSQPCAEVSKSEEISLRAMLAEADQFQQKQILGSNLYPVIEAIYPNLGGKITGILLQMDSSELVEIFLRRNVLRAKVEEALAVLQAHEAIQSHK